MPTPRRSHRRAFLKGQAARDAVEDFSDGIHSTQPQPSVAADTSPKQTYLVEFARSAMAVEFQVLLNAPVQDEEGEAAIEALDLVEQLESQLTVYRDTSEVSRMNRTAAVHEIKVEPRLFALFEKALAIWRATAGAYDMTSGPLSKVWGFYRRQGRMPADDEIAAAVALVGSQHLLLDPTTRTIRFAIAGMEINLGGIGKGYALDRMREVLVSHGAADFLLHGGHSSVLARGSRAGAPEDRVGWIVGLAHPLRPEERLAEFRLHNQALGTSGSGTQFFHHQGKRYGHILDPRSGRPAEGVLSATVISPTAAESDALSTAFYVGGLDLARRYCAQHPDISAVMVASRGVQLELEAINLPADSWQRLR